MSSTTATTNIRYIVLSDLHLGQDRSVLTAVDADEQPTAEKTEPALEALMNCLQYLVEQNVPRGNEKDRPTLILLGDIIEQAFTNIDVAGPIFQGFVEKWRERGTGRNPIFDKVVFIPGNHDHNMWEFTRAYQYWKSLSEGSEKAAQEPRSKLSSSPTSRHATELREGYTGDRDLIGLLINRQLEVTPQLPVEIYYPTFALGSGKRAVLFNHGHYFESLYQLMSTLLPYVIPGASPQAPTAEDIERNNFAWLDFVWSTLGRQGDHPG